MRKIFSYANIEQFTHKVLKQTIFHTLMQRCRVVYYTIHKWKLNRYKDALVENFKQRNTRSYFHFYKPEKTLINDLKNPHKTF